MKKMLRKLKSKAGETIGETLVALLIASFALLMLAGAISTSTGIITRSSDKIDNYFEKANSSLVEMKDAASGNVVIKEKTGSVRMNVPVTYGTNDDLGDKPVISFKVKKSE